MSSPIEGTPASRAPRLAASMIPGPPPVMIAKPASPSSRAARARALVLGMVARRARGAEDRDRLADVRERGEPGAQLLVDPLDPRRVVEVGLDVDGLGLEQLLVERLGAPAVVIGMRVHRDRVGAD